MLCEVATGRLIRQTARSETPPVGDAVVFSPNGDRIAYLRDIDGYNQIFVVTVMR
jgi:Tol biopolymer transport system component